MTVTAIETDSWTDLVELRSFETAIDAHLARGLLEVEGIPCSLRDEHSVGSDQRLSLALGGVKLDVRPEDLARARTVLAAKTSVAGRNTFRVVKHLGGIALALGFLPSFLVFGLVFSQTLHAPLSIGVLVACFGFFYWRGSQRLKFSCSEPSCLSPMARSALVCPGCAGAIRGEIEDRSERLAAQERWEGRSP